MSMPQPVTALEHRERYSGNCTQKNGHDGQTPKRVDVRDAEETVAESVNHVEKRIEMREPLPESGERMDRVEHPREKGERHDEEVLEGRDLVDFLGPDSGDHPERSQYGASGESERDDPQRMAKFDLDERQGHQQYRR